MPSKWYLQKLEVGLHLLQTCEYFHNRKPKYIALCNCGDTYATGSKDSIIDWRINHEFGKHGKHKVQTFIESKII